MKIELPVLWSEETKVSKNDELDELTRRVLEIEDEKTTSYSEGMIILDSVDFKSWNADGERTTLRTYQGDNYTVLLAFEMFSTLFTSITDENIYQIKITKTKKSKNE